MTFCFLNGTVNFDIGRCSTNSYKILDFETKLPNPQELKCHSNQDNDEKKPTETKPRYPTTDLQQRQAWIESHSKGC